MSWSMDQALSAMVFLPLVSPVSKTPSIPDASSSLSLASSISLTAFRKSMSLCSISGFFPFACHASHAREVLTAWS